MIKLYKKDGPRLLYHEAWSHGRKVTEHWGECPSRGETKTHALKKGIDSDEFIEEVLSSARSRGFAEIEMDAHARLLIEFKIEGLGSAADLKKRHALESRMSETLGWAGIGMCDGGSIGSGTMEVCCFVADYDIARAAVITDLSESEFADYQRIYREE